MPEVYAIKDAAEKLKVSPDTIRRERDAGRLKASKIGRIWRILEEDLKAYLEANSNINRKE